MSTLLNKPMSTKGEGGVKSVPKSVYVFMEAPLISRVEVLGTDFKKSMYCSYSLL